MKRTKEEAEQTRRDILNAALPIFSRKGYMATTLADIGKAAGVTRGAIYHHFADKEALYLALFDEASALGNQAIQRATAEGGSFLQIVERILVYTLNLLEDDVQFRQVMRLSLSVVEVEGLTQRRYQEAEQLVMGIAGAFEGGAASGELRPDLDPVTAARAFLAFQNGLALLWFSNQEAFSIKEQAAELAQVFLRGIAAA